MATSTSSVLGEEVLGEEEDDPILTPDEDLIHDWMAYSPILQLPTEIRSPIWAYLSPCSRKAIRLTCKTFRNEIDTTLGLPIDLDERLFKRRDILTTLPPSASSLRVWGSELTHHFLSRLLYNPRLLTSITFSGPTEVSLVKKVLSRCQHLEEVTLTDRVQFDTRFLIPYRLRNVKSLTLGARESGRRKVSRPTSALTPGPLPQTSWVVYSDLLTNLGFPCLKRLRLEYTLPPEVSSVSGYAAMFRIILKYLLAHKSVNDLTLRLHKGVASSEPGSLPPPPPKVGVRGKVNINLKNPPRFLPLDPKDEAQLQSFTGFKRLLISTDPELAKIWEMVLITQKKLEVLDFLNQGSDWELLSKVVKNNRRSLQVIRLRRLLPDDGPLKDPQARVDLGAFEFESCLKLRELFLSRFEDSTREVCLKGVSDGGGGGCGGQKNVPFLDRASSKFPELIRIKAIPKFLERLHIQGFTIKTDDLLALPDKMSSRLKVLELQLLGYNPGNCGSSPQKQLRKEHGGGDQGDGHDYNYYEDEEKNLKPKTSSSSGGKDISREGFGVTAAVLRKIVSKMRGLETLFVEEFHNDRTDFGEEGHDFGRALKKVNLVPGDCHLKSLGYFGVLVANKDQIPRAGAGVGRTSGFGDENSTSGLDPELWDVRFNQYRTQHKEMRNKKQIQNRPL